MLAEPREARIKQSTFRMNPSSPGHIDLMTIFEDRNESIHTQGILEIVGDELRYSVAPPGHARPAEFATRAGDGLTFVVLKRARENR